MKNQTKKTFFLPGLLICSFIITQPVFSQTTNNSGGNYNKTIPHNPVLDIDFPDPTVIHLKGVYYAYATQSSHNGKMVNIQVATSTDMFNWKYIGDALPQKPVWASNTQSFWAPHVLYDSSMKKFVMFFCAKSNDTSVNMGIGVAYSDKPAGPFIPNPSPLMVATKFGDIDPMAMIDPQTGKKIIYWGSGFEPIRAQELTDDWSTFKEGTTEVAVEYPHKESIYSKLIEGAWVDYHNGKYYLYYSGDNCCGDNANYAVMVARADSAFGPYETLAESNHNNSSVILEKDSTWLAPGHNSIFKDDKGNEYIAYHAIWRDKEKAGVPKGKSHYLKRVMCIEPVKYINGWPVIIHKY